MVVELVALGRLGAEQRASGRQQVGALEVVLLVDQEVLLLGAHGGEHPPRVLDAEQLQRADRRAGERVHRAQQRDLVVERLARPGGERGGDAQQRAVGVLQQERGRGRVPGGVAARLEGRADAAGRERGGVGLALDQLLAGELRDRGAVADGAVEGVVLLRGGARQRLKPVRVVRGAPLQRPLLHRLRHGVRQRGVERLAALERLLQRLVHVLGQALALHDRAEHVGGEHLVAGEGEVERAEGAAVGAPLCGCDVLLACPGHGGVLFLLVANLYEWAPEAWGRRRPALRRPILPRIGPTMNRRPLRGPGHRSTGEIPRAIFRQRANWCARRRSSSGPKGAR